MLELHLDLAWCSGLLADHAYLISSLSSTMTAALLFIFVSGKYQAHGRAHTIKQQRKLYTKVWIFLSSYEVTSTKFSRSLGYEFATGGLASVFLVLKLMPKLCYLILICIPLFPV